MANNPDQSDLGGWVIDSQRSHYSIAYWVEFFFSLFGQIVPIPPEITYTVRNPGSGEIRTITLPGDHARSELANAIARPRDHSGANG